MSDEMENPYSDTTTIGVSRQLGADLALHADGVYTHTDKFNATVRINTPDPVTRVRPIAGWGVIQEVQSIGEQWYQALLVRLEKRLSARHSTRWYTLSKVKDDSSARPPRETSRLLQQALDKGYATPTGATTRGQRRLRASYDITLGRVDPARQHAVQCPAGRDLNGEGATRLRRARARARATSGSTSRRQRLAQQNGLAAVSEDQIDSNDFNRVDVRAARRSHGGTRRVEFIGQVFNLFGRNNLGGIGIRARPTRGRTPSAASGAQPAAQGEIAVRTTW